MFRPTSSDLMIFHPALAARPATRIKVDGQIKGLFLSTPKALPEGTSSVQAVKPHSEPALAVWVGEKKGAPATVSLYPISALVGQGQADADKTDTRDMPTTTARKAFYKADKLQVKWNNAGTMVSITTMVRRVWLLIPGLVLDSHGCRQHRQILLRRDQPLPCQPGRIIRWPSRPGQRRTYWRFRLEPYLQRIHCLLRM
jgi:translation initiation factor 2A